MERLSYYELALTDYLAQHHPDKIEDRMFIKERNQKAEDEFSRCSREGLTVEDSLARAKAVLYQHLTFSPYEMIKEILESEFKEVEEGERNEIAMQMLEHNKDILKKYDIEDDEFHGSRDYMTLYNEMTGAILIYLEENGLQ